MVTSLNKKIWRDLKTLKVQVLTLSVLVVCGVAVLVASWSSYQSLVRSRDHYYAEYRFADLFSTFIKSPEDNLKRVEQIPGVEFCEGRIVKDVLVDVMGQPEPAVGRFISLLAYGRKGLNQIYLRSGRMPESQPTQHIEAVVYEGFAVAHRLRPGDKVSALFQGQKRDVVIVGLGISPEYVSAQGSAMPVPDDKHFGVFWVDHAALAKLTEMVGSINDISVRVARGASIAEVKSNLDQLFKPYGALGAIGREQQRSNVAVEDEIGQQRAMAWFNPLVFLSVAAFLIHVVISRLVGLHRSQIATLKSLGYHDSAISFYYVKLVFIMMMIGTIAGIALGMQLGNMEVELYKRFFRFPSLDFALDSWSLVVAIFAGIIPGFIGAFTSFRSIYKLQPAEAMRPLSPPAFHKGLIDKLGLIHHLSMSGRMIFRALFSKPIRFLFTVLGISFGVAVMINGGFWFDTMDYIIESQFQRANRENLSVQFFRPKSTDVLNELRHIPGVMLTEGYRVVPVRTRFLNWSREVVLYGVHRESTMRKVLDIEGRPLRIPEEGAYFSRFFANKFNLQRGDIVDVEILEGGARTVQLEVSGFVDDLVGSAVYVSAENLKKILQESTAINVATLKVDPLYTNSIYVRLKAFPEVSSVSVREIVYKGFMTNIAGMVRVFTWIIVGFAVAIAASVMYNSARVSFSERSWELASLQIFGFSRFQAWQILFAEIGIQVLCALLPGMFFGYWLSDLSIQLIHNETFKFPLRIETSTYAGSVLVLLFTYVVSGLFVLQMVSRLDLVEALKSRE